MILVVFFTNDDLVGALNMSCYFICHVHSFSILPVYDDPHRFISDPHWLISHIFPGWNRMISAGVFYHLGFVVKQ